MIWNDSKISKENFSKTKSHDRTRTEHIPTLRRCREYAESLTAEERESGECYTAFELTAILGIAFGLNPAQVMWDYINQK